MAAVITAIILIGLLLIFLEIFFIPGTTLFGIGGGVAVVIGVVLVYLNYSTKTGNIVMAVVLVAVLLSIFAGFKLIQTNTFGMEGTISGKVNEADPHPLKEGDRGRAITELRPNGKAVFENFKTEVYSSGDYIARETEIEIIKINNNRIIVETLKS